MIAHKKALIMSNADQLRKIAEMFLDIQMLFF
jgi:hypothetical protein